MLIQNIQGYSLKYQIQKYFYYVLVLLLNCNTIIICSADFVKAYQAVSPFKFYMKLSKAHVFAYFILRM